MSLRRDIKLIQAVNCEHSIMHPDGTSYWFCRKCDYCSTGRLSKRVRLLQDAAKLARCGDKSNGDLK